MTDHAADASGQDTEQRVVTAERIVAAPATTVFELIADPVRQPSWDGNDNLSEAVRADRITAAGQLFAMRLTNGQVRDNHVVAFREGALIAWRPSLEGEAPIGHEWRWEVEQIDEGSSRVRHVYDWTDLTDETRLPRARRTGEEQLRASLDRLAEAAESDRG